VRETNLVKSLDNTSQQLIILPTEHCNFRCTYCYEDFNIGRMRPAIVSGIKTLIEKRAPDLKYLQVSWFGGEPLLAKNIVMDIMQHANRLAKIHKFELGSSITTNAYLLSNDTFSDLCSVNVLRYQITLDGPQAVHDRTRIRADGAGTFETIFRNIEHIHHTKNPVKVVLRVHYSEANYELIPELLTRLSEICKVDDRFQVHLKSIENLGGSNSNNIRTWGNGRRAELHEKLSKFIPDSSVIKFDEYMCYASKPNSLVIRADGSLAKCTVAFSSPKNNIGTINEEGEIDIDKNKTAYWIRGLFSGNQAELGCPANDQGIRITEIRGQQ
jgi:uncharacterized protein